MKYHLSYFVETPSGARYSFSAPDKPTLLKRGCNNEDEVRGSLYNFVFSSKEEAEAFDEQNGKMVRESLVEIAHSVSIAAKDTGVCSWSS